MLKDGQELSTTAAANVNAVTLTAVTVKAVTTAAVTETIAGF